MTRTCILIWLAGVVGAIAGSSVYAIFWGTGSPIGTTLETIVLPQFSSEEASVEDVAGFLRAQLARQGREFDVMVDSRIGGFRVKHAFVGQGNVILWLHGMQKIYDINFELIEPKGILLRQKQ